MNNQNDKKIVWLLILQAWAMLWVVIGHAGPANTLKEYPNWATILWNFAYSFHMQLFIMISGFLFYLTRINNEKWTYLPMLKEKLVRFGIPFVVFTSFAMVIKSVFSSQVERATTISFSEFFHAILYPYDGPMREFWFLGVIMWLFALYPVWKIALKNFPSKVITSVIVLVMFFISPETNFLAIHHTFIHISFFWWGILCANIYLRYKEDGGGKFFSTGYLLSMLVLSAILYVVVVNYSILYLPAVFGIFLSFSLCMLLYKFVPIVFCSFRNYTYQIYLMGLFVQELVKMIRYKMGLPFEPVYVVSIIAGLYVPVLIALAVKKLNIKPLKLCIGLK